MQWSFDQIQFRQLNLYTTSNNLKNGVNMCPLYIAIDIFINQNFGDAFLTDSVRP